MMSPCWYTLYSYKTPIVASKWRLP